MKEGDKETETYQEPTVDRQLEVDTVIHISQKRKPRFRKMLSLA